MCCLLEYCSSLAHDIVQCAPPTEKVDTPDSDDVCTRLIWLWTHRRRGLVSTDVEVLVWLRTYLPSLGDKLTYPVAKLVDAEVQSIRRLISIPQFICSLSTRLQSWSVCLLSYHLLRKYCSFIRLNLFIGSAWY
jgi:hypothetical protein